MKWIVWLILAQSTAALAQESTIRILGVYPAGQSYSSADMTMQLQYIADVWNNSGMAASSVTSVTVLNLATAIPVDYALPSTMEQAADFAYSNSAIQAARQAYQADVVILFASYPSNCGFTNTFWHDGHFQPDGQGLDLDHRNVAYLSVVNPSCHFIVAAHEFGHLGGGGHRYTGSRLYDYSRAAVYNFDIPEIGWSFAVGTALADPTDTPYALSYEAFYSDGSDNPSLDNSRTLDTTARSMANLYEYPSGPAVLYPPVDLWGINRGCQGDGVTRHDFYWNDHPSTNVPISHYEVWKEQPLGNTPVYGWTVYAPFTPIYVWGTVGRATVKACSGTTCSALSTSYYEATLACPNDF